MLCVRLFVLFVLGCCRVLCVRVGFVVFVCVCFVVVRVVCVLLYVVCSVCVCVVD